MYLHSCFHIMYLSLKYLCLYKNHGFTFHLYLQAICVCFDQSFVTLFHCSLSSSLCFLTQNKSITGLKYSQCALSRKCWVISLDCDSNKCFFFNISQIKNSYLQGIQSFTNRAVGKFSVCLTEPN